MRAYALWCVQRALLLVGRHQTQHLAGQVPFPSWGREALGKPEELAGFLSAPQILVVQGPESPPQRRLLISIVLGKALSKAFPFSRYQLLPHTGA